MSGDASDLDFRLLHIQGALERSAAASRDQAAAVITAALIATRQGMLPSAAMRLFDEVYKALFPDQPRNAESD